jgi:hypothetical protein
LPEPLLVPINLLEVDTIALENGMDDPVTVQLVHPNLGARGLTPARAGAAVAVKVVPARADDQDSGLA